MNKNLFVNPRLSDRVLESLQGLAQIPSGNRGSFFFQSSDLLLQGFQVGQESVEVDDFQWKTVLHLLQAWLHPETSSKMASV